ncbi:reverse transcriptase domain-containing protein [Tanacetum coccineum]
MRWQSFPCLNQESMRCGKSGSTPESGPSTALKMTVPSTTEEKICKKNDVKAQSLLLMELPNEHQLTFNQYVDAQSMFVAIKARFGGNEATKRTQKAPTSNMQGVVTPPEDLNVKFLRSLPSEWDTHVVVWMNKPDFDTIGLDGLYKNFKIVEQKIKRSTGAINDEKNLAFLTTTGASSINNINTVNPEVSTGTTKVNTASTETSTASFSDATVYAFLSTQPQGSQLVHEDLEQLHDDICEEMDHKVEYGTLSMRARKFYQRTRRKIIIGGSNTAGCDKSKVECFNCHKIGHFARDARATQGKDNRNWNQGGSSKAVRIEDASEKAMCAIDGAGFDWSDMAEEEIQANMALMAFSDAEVSNDKSCSKSCLQNYEALKKQYDDLLVKLDDTAFKASTYKRGLSILEGQILKYKESEVLFSEEIALLKRSVGHKEYLMGLLKTELEKVKEEKEGFEFKIAKFEKSSKDLDQLLASQITDKSKKGFGYNAVPSPHPLILNRPTSLDLSYSGLQEFKQPEVNEYGHIGYKCKAYLSLINTDFRVEASKKARENNDAPIIEDWVSGDEDDVESIPKLEKKTVIPTVTKKEFVKPKTPVRRSVSCPNVHKCMVPRAVLMKTGLKTVNNARPVNTVRSVNTARPFSTARQNVNTVMSNSQLNDKGFVDSGCSRHMSGNIAHLSDFKDFDGGYVTFGGGANGGRITGKGTIKTDKLDFDDVYFVKELKFNGTDIQKESQKRPNQARDGKDKFNPKPKGQPRFAYKEPPQSILTWDDLVSKFINKFFPPSKMTNLRNEITRFQQRFDESFYEAWDRFNDLLRACPHHGFSELHQLDTFYNALNTNDQDSLNSAAGGNFLDKMPRECLKIIESKSKVRNSRSKPVVAKVSASTSTSGISPDVSELKDMVKALLLDKKNQSQAPAHQTPAPVKAVEQSCVTCGGGHSYQNCPATDGNIYRDNIQEYVSQAAAVNYNQGNASYRPQMIPPDLELKDLPSHLEYAFLEGDDKLPVIIAKNLKDEDKTALIKILMEENAKPVVQHQRRVNPKIYEVIKQEVIKLLDAGLIYPISNSPWVSPVHCVPKKGGITMVKNEENELIPTRLVTGWRVCIDYQKLNDATRKDHFPLPFMDQMLERLAGNEYYCFLDGFSGYFQIPIDPLDQEKTTIHPALCTGTFAIGVMVAIFHDMIEKTMGSRHG